MHDQVERLEEMRVGSIILAPGYQPYQAEQSAEFGYGRYPNVLTSLQFERMLSASGPTMGHVRRPSDDQTPERIAFLQCIGSRDQEHDYCSAVCCMSATKEAMIAKEHEPGFEIQVFQMDLRAFSKGYWEYFQRAQERYGIQYTRCRISRVDEDPRTKDLEIVYQDEQGRRLRKSFNMVVLSVGMEISEGVKSLSRRIGVDLDEFGFCQTDPFEPLQTSRSGIFAVGPFREPK
ncbi:MAG: CoB--CoM heterodisulfide reductase iron-sulfur subunit A family protein, partial [Desulfuromonadales bacterium]|nr:CoB--CoM heterodisulfide reductase iron-sulfur subunit A family protein [Desulfuromonadales bacterium]